MTAPNVAVSHEERGVSMGESTNAVHMPTGEELPAGFDAIYDAEAIEAHKGVHTDFVTVSQLSDDERAEIEHLREHSQEYFLSITGREPTRESFEDWLSFSPMGRTRSDQMIFRAYSGRYLAGYAHVFCRLPVQNEWTISTLVIEPAFRGHRIGTQLLAKIEEVALRSQITGINFAAVQTEDFDDNFWIVSGYTEELTRFEWTVGGTPREILINHKELEQPSA